KIDVLRAVETQFVIVSWFQRNRQRACFSVTGPAWPFAVRRILRHARSSAGPRHAVSHRNVERDSQRGRFWIDVECAVFRAQCYYLRKTNSEFDRIARAGGCEGNDGAGSRRAASVPEILITGRVDPKAIEGALF